MVAQEFATTKDVDLFSGTPSLPVVKAMLADLAHNRQDRALMLLDVTGAFLYGNAKRNVAVRLPKEVGAGPDEVGLLRRSLYGLRDAPQIWQQCVTTTQRMRFH